MIGVLALQGAFAEHEHCLDLLGVPYGEIRKRENLDRPYDALILPGGESTAMTKLMRDMDMIRPLRDMILNGTPIFGTCAGLILLSKVVEGGVPSLATMDVRTVRNAYGRQLGSFNTAAAFKGIGEIPMTFIRAPYVASVGPGADVMAEVDGHIVAVRQGNQLATAFHPELTNSLSVHRYFLSEIASIL